MIHTNIGNTPDGCHPDIRQILDYWLSIHPDNGLPSRQHVDPLHFSRHLPNIRLIDVVDDPPRFRVRLTGERIAQHFRASQVGMFFDEINPDFEARESFIAFTTAVRTKEPYWNSSRCELDAAKDFVALERVVLPLAGDGTNVDALLVLALLGNVATQVNQQESQSAA